MRNQLVSVVLSMLLFAGLGSSAVLTHALAGSKAPSPQRAKPTPIQRAKRLGPKPTPQWYWRWAAWRLGEGYAKGHAVQLDLRPRRAPHRIPVWSWRRFHFFLMQRKLAHAGTQRQHVAHTTTTTTTTTNTAPGTKPPTTSPGWTNVINDQFDSGGLPSHWLAYSSPYGSAPRNCTSPTHDYVSGGFLHIVESYEASRPAGANCPYSAGWYTGGLKLNPVAPYIANDQQVTVRYRIVSTGGVVSHHIIPMRWPTGIHYVYRMNNGEEDFPETDTLTTARTFLHYVANGSGQQTYSPVYSVDMTQWHTMRFTQLKHTIYAYFDNMSTPAWTYAGNGATVPDVLRTTVLQQECNHTSGCPSGTTGSEDIQIDWIAIDNAS
jgi:hypothetical protein